MYCSQFSCLLCIQTVSDIELYQTVYCKMHSIDVKLKRLAHKLDTKLQSLCWSDFSLFAVHMLAISLTTWSELINNTFRKQKWGTFLYPNYECQNRQQVIIV